MDEEPGQPRLAFVHVDDVPWTEVVAQQHGDRRVSVREKFLEWTPERMAVFTPPPGVAGVLGRGDRWS